MKVTKSLVDGVVYERTHKIVADATKNFFSIDLKSMTDKMSAENLAVFNRNALVNNTTFTVKDAKGDVVAGLMVLKLLPWSLRVSLLLSLIRMVKQ